MKKKDLSEEAMYAYLGGKEKDEKKPSDEFKRTIYKPFDQYKLARLIGEIQNAIEALNTGKALPPKRGSSAGA